MTTFTIDLPERFYWDHVSRADNVAVGRLLTTSRTVRVELTVPELAELFSDASHYANSRSAFGPELAGVCMSAAATVKRIEKLLAPLGGRVTYDSILALDRAA